MSRFDRMAIIGAADLVFGLRAMGVRTFSPQNADEARRILAGIVKEDYALCLVHQDWLDVLKEEREEIGQRFCPVVLGFSDYRALTDLVERMVREMAVKATGSDSLVRGKGNNE
ncbi:MAG TPA: V-type ATP synthase subunit F [Candidatus Desulfaltia sp.]|nr:V-type ATP synthase subunit F [Candidatus Desulfaltia sp.]